MDRLTWWESALTWSPRPSIARSRNADDFVSIVATEDPTNEGRWPCCKNTCTVATNEDPQLAFSIQTCVSVKAHFVDAEPNWVFFLNLVENVKGHERLDTVQV